MKSLLFARGILIAAGLMLVQATASAQVVTTLAGSGRAGSQDGTGAEASFSNPLSVAVDPSGNVYVADTGNAKIRKISPNGLVTTFADFRTGYPNSPTGVTVDGFGNVWEVDPVGDGIDGGDLTKWAPDGHPLGFRLEWPSVDLPPLVGDDVVGIAADRTGNLYATTFLSGVVRFDTNGKGTILTKGLGGLPGIATDGFGNVYIADTGRLRIVKVTAAGDVIVLAGSGTAGNADGTGTAASFRGPTGLAVDSSGNVYVADQGNHLIRKITPTGIVTTVAGSGRPGSADGIGGAASFNSPAGVAIDYAGNLYVADSGNNKIRKITLEGERFTEFEVLDVWVTGAGETGYLAVTSSSIALGVLDASGNTTRERSYGPYDQWVPVAAAGSLDDLSRVLWQNVDGRWDVWLVGPDGVLGSFVFPEEPGLTAVDVAGGPSGQTHVLSRSSRGAFLRTIDGEGNLVTTVALGTYPGWAATAISDGADGMTRLLWNNDDGRFGLSVVSSSGIVTTARFASEPGWTAIDVAVGGDGLARLLRAYDDAQIGLLVVDGAGRVVAQGPVYDVPVGFKARHVSAGLDGSSRVLLSSETQGSVAWFLSPDGIFQGSFPIPALPRR
jgi:sugar lactone lactonase YvrE